MTFITILPSAPVRMRSSLSVFSQGLKESITTTSQQLDDDRNGKHKKMNRHHFLSLLRSWCSLRCSFIFASLFVLTFYLCVAIRQDSRIMRLGGSSTTEVLTYPDTAAAMERRPPQNTNNRPYFVLHIGPPKSATTTLQYDLTDFQDVLHSEDAQYNYLGNTMRNPHDMWDHGHSPLLNLLLHRPCMRQVNHIRTQHGADPSQYPACWQKVRAILASYRERNESIIISEEFLSIRYATMEGAMEPTSVDWAALAQLLEEQDFTPVIVVGYRRLFDILPSAKQQWDRYYRGNMPLTLWPGQGGRTLEPLFPNVLGDPRLYKGYTSTEKRSKDIIPWSYTDHLVRTIAPFLPVRILALHQGLSVRENFFCHVLPDAPRSCAQARAQATSETVFNQEESLFYDALGCAAADHGLLDKAQYDRRPVALAMQSYHEKKKGAPDFPLTCPSDESTQVLLELSLQKEKEIFAPQWTQAWRDSHIAHFLKNREKNKFCWIDVEAALQQPLWQNFFEKELDTYMQEQAENDKGDDDDDESNAEQESGDAAYERNGGQEQKGYKFRYVKYGE